MPSSLSTPAGWLLRPWDTADAGELRIALEAEETDRQLGAVLSTDAAAVEWIRQRQYDWAAGAACSWAVQSPDGRLMGSASVSSVNRTHDTGWISYWTAIHARGRGIATEATVQLAEWSLTELGLFRLELGHRVNNPASCAVATAAGFRVEGIERAKLRYRQSRFDVELHARLATDAAAPPLKS